MRGTGRSTLARIGEAGLLEMIFRRLGRPRRPGRALVLGPGDDAGLLRVSPGRLLVASRDDLVEGTHFELRWADFGRLGGKLLRVNLSDLAAMGAVRPLAVLVSAGFPGRLSVSRFREFLDGLAKTARRYRVAVLGGNLTRSSRIFLSATILGEARPRHLIRRSGAKFGDLLCGFGPLGLAACGLEVLNGRALGGRWDPLVRAFWEPEPQLKAGRILAESGLATSLLDNSDGLHRSAEILGRASGVGIQIALSRAPRPKPLEDWCRRTGRDPRRRILEGGEDYGLIFTVPRSKWTALRRRLPGAYPLGVVVDRRWGVCVPELGRGSAPCGFEAYA